VAEADVVLRLSAHGTRPLLHGGCRGDRPPFFLIYHAVRGLIVALPKFTAEGFFMLGILWTHVVIVGGILYLIAT
jgi:hypothetical protein